MKTLFITYHYLNGNGGGVFASRAYINAFAELSEDMTLLYPMKEGAEPESINPAVKSIPVWDNRSKMQKALGVFTGRTNRFRNIERFIEDERFDIVVFDTSLVVHGIVDSFRKQGAKVVTIHHNYQYEYFRDNVGFPFRLPTLFWSKRFESEAIRKSDLNLTLTDSDRQLLKKHYGTGKEIIEILGVFEYSHKFHSAYPDVCEPKFLITGDLGAKQTIVSLTSFLDNYFPLLEELFPGAILTLAGKNPSPELLRLANKYNVQVIPSPGNMSPILASAKYYLCPISLGGGMKLRVMDGLSAGLPVVCHIVSARGYEVFIKTGEVLPYHDIASFREQMVRLQSYSKTKQEAIELFEHCFSFESGCGRLSLLLKSHHIV